MSLSSEELKQIPLRYRWLIKLFMKLPNPSFPYFVLKKIPEIEGIFWAAVAPVLLIANFFFFLWFVTFLSAYVIFPFNLLFGVFIPALLFIFFLRIQLERAILWWKNLQSTSKEWDISKAAKELIELFRKQQKEAENVT